MKFIFLDIDGVLNSGKYDNSRDESQCQFLDRTRLVLLKQLVDNTDAKIVLSSTWRFYWSKNKNEMRAQGEEMNQVFNSEGLSIYDKTPVKCNSDRREEILLWLKNQSEIIESFVIIDDTNFGWKDLQDYWVKTSYYKGYGLEQSHIDQAIKILGKTF